MKNDITLFRNDFLQSVLLHIPHSSALIPDYTGFVNIKKVEDEINLLTDHATDLIFNVEGIDNITFPYSRVFCDVERLDDENETMFEFGRGYFYTNSDNGVILRNDINGIKENVYTNYYLPHHTKLNNNINTKLKETGLCYIIDCHSFSDSPFKTDIIKDGKRPDVCIGIDAYHTPKWLEDYIRQSFIKHGFDVSINDPYSGTIIPLEHYNKNENVKGIMIEINRKLYIDNGNVNLEKVEKLNKIISEILQF